MVGAIAPQNFGCVTAVYT